MKPLPDYDPAQDLDQGQDVPNPEHYDFPPFNRWDALCMGVGAVLIVIEAILI